MRAVRTTVLAKSAISATHNWPAPSNNMMLLKNEHHHVFTVEAELEVTHEDREVEFIQVSLRVRELLEELGGEPRDKLYRFGSMSCEKIARTLGQRLAVSYGERWMSITVREDDIHGATVVLVPDNEE